LYDFKFLTLGGTPGRKLIIVPQNGLKLADLKVAADALGEATANETKRIAEASTAPIAPRARAGKTLVRTFNATPSSGGHGPAPLAARRSTPTGRAFSTRRNRQARVHGPSNLSNVRNEIQCPAFNVNYSGFPAPMIVTAVFMTGSMKTQIALPGTGISSSTMVPPSSRILLRAASSVSTT